MPEGILKAIVTIGFFIGFIFLGLGLINFIFRGTPLFCWHSWVDAGSWVGVCEWSGIYYTRRRCLLCGKEKIRGRWY